MDNKTKYHTISHIALIVIKEMYGHETEWSGGNMDDERLRFDFDLERKMSDEEKIELVDRINKYIDMNLPVTKLEMTLEEAKSMGAHGTFEYGNTVSVYKLGDISLEICGGPHVKNTSELSHVKLIKEESVGKGIRRVKLVMI
ncbi:MAG: hypothetical protein PHO63_03445 [Bacilli bacterium]|nr:hypothetical protein [Bacilli bacterium]MDD4808888.1 hypothetical protein [Bacilli bacterium]